MRTFSSYDSPSMIEEIVEVVLDLEVREHERVPRSRVRVGVPCRRVVLLHSFLPFMRVLVVERRGVMMGLTLYMSLKVQRRRGVMPR